MNNEAIPAPVQSHLLELENIPAPNAMTRAELQQPETLIGRKRAAVVYESAIHAKHRKSAVIKLQDVEEAERYADSLRVAAVMMPLVGPDHPVAVANTLQQILDELQAIRTGQLALQMRQANALAQLPEDVVMLPPVQGVPMPPHEMLPATVADLLGQLTASQCTALEAYFSFGPLAGGLAARRARIVRLGYGVRRLQVHAQIL